MDSLNVLYFTSQRFCLFLQQSPEYMYYDFWYMSCYDNCKHLVLSIIVSESRTFLSKVSYQLLKVHTLIPTTEWSL